MIGWYPPSNDSSDLTWHMFMHVVETNQHSLHDIYVHGGLYPTHACTWCKLILMHVHDCCRSLSWSLPSLILCEASKSSAGLTLLTCPPDPTFFPF